LFAKEPFQLCPSPMFWHWPGRVVLEDSDVEAEGSESYLHMMSTWRSTPMILILIQHPQLHWPAKWIYLQWHERSCTLAVISF
jgi:hypothetical protein